MTLQLQAHTCYVSLCELSSNSEHVCLGIVLHWGLGGLEHWFSGDFCLELNVRAMRPHTPN